MGRKLLLDARQTGGLKALLLLLSVLCMSFAMPVTVHSQSGVSPQFPTPKTARYLAENSAPFSNVGLPIVATDPDPRDRLTYSLSGRDVDSFSIVETTGQLQALRPLDYETRPATI